MVERTCPKSHHFSSPCEYRIFLLFMWIREPNQLYKTNQSDSCSCKEEQALSVWDTQRGETKEWKLNVFHRRAACTEPSH